MVIHALSHWILVALSELNSIAGWYHRLKRWTFSDSK